MKNFFEGLFLAFLISIAVLVYSKDWLVKKAFESTVTTLTGFKTEVGNLQLDFGQATLHLKDLKIYNPEQFERRVFAHIPEIYVRVDIPALLRKERLHFYDLRFDVREVNIEKNEKGISNVTLLSSIAKRNQEKVSSPSDLESSKPALPFYLDRLELTLRKVNYVDRSSMIQNKVSVDLNIEDHIFTGIKDPKAIVNLVLVKILYSTTFGNLGLDAGEIKGTLTKTVDMGGELLKATAGEVIEKTGGVLQATVGGAQKIIEEAPQSRETIKAGGEVLKQTTGVLAEKTGVVVKETTSQAKDILSQTAGVAKGEITHLFGKLKSKVATKKENVEDPLSEDKKT